MSIIKIKVLVENKMIKQHLTTTAIFQESTIKYQEEDKTKVILNLKNSSLIRENDKLRMNYLFKKNKETKGNVFFKEYQKSIDIILKTTSIKKKNKNIEIRFTIENDEFLYRIEEIK